MTLIISGTDSRELHGRGGDGPCWGLIVTVQKIGQVLLELLIFQVETEICIGMSNLPIFRYRQAIFKLILSTPTNILLATQYTFWC